MLRLWEEYQSLLDESREKAIRENTNKPSSKGSLAEKTERMAEVRKKRKEGEDENKDEEKQSKKKITARSATQEATATQQRRTGWAPGSWDVVTQEY